MIIFANDGQGSCQSLRPRHFQWHWTPSLSESISEPQPISAHSIWLAAVFGRRAVLLASNVKDWSPSPTFMILVQTKKQKTTIRQSIVREPCTKSFISWPCSLFTELITLARCFNCSEKLFGSTKNEWLISVPRPLRKYIYIYLFYCCSSSILPVHLKPNNESNFESRPDIGR